MKIAVTGGLGSGKSTVSKILASSLGCGRIDTDELCRSQLQPGNMGMERFRDAFGYKFLHPDGTLNRQALRSATFKDQAVKFQLETILHPVVREAVNDRWKRRNTDEAHLVVEVPLLYEVQWQNDFDQCIVVYVPENLVYPRVVKRSGLDIVEIRRILNVQMPIEEKLAYTELIVDNSGTLASTVLQADYLVRTLLL